MSKSNTGFRDLELIEVLDNGAIYMLDIQNFIGKSSTEADRKRDYRQQIKKEKDSLLLNDVTNVTTNVRTSVQKRVTNVRTNLHQR